jgi:hypothetical protein
MLDFIFEKKSITVSSFSLGEVKLAIEDNDLIDSW